MGRDGHPTTMVETEAGGSLVGSVVEMVRQFAAVATASPEQAVLLAVGVVLTTAAMAVFGLLALGAAVEWLVSLRPGSRGPSPPG